MVINELKKSLLSMFAENGKHFCFHFLFFAGTEVPVPLPGNNFHANCVQRGERLTGRTAMDKPARDAS